MTADLDALEKLREAATPGEWYATVGNAVWVALGSRRYEVAKIPESQAAQADAAYIAALHNALPDLIALARDGERYRFLRTCRNMGHDPDFAVVELVTDAVIWGEELDAAIDSERGKK